MRITIVNCFESNGGAAKAARRLFLALRAQGAAASMVVQHRSSNHGNVSGPTTKFQRFVAQLRPALDVVPARLARGYYGEIFSSAVLPASTSLDLIRQSLPDVLNLHWINGGQLSTGQLHAFHEHPLVWTLHDSWLFTGGCHMPYECSAFEQTCGSCPALGSRRKRDLSAFLFQRKHRALGGLSKAVYVTPSKWLRTQALRSRILGGSDVRVVGNAIDTQAFSPFGKREARHLLNLPQDSRLIGFGAMSALRDRRKGADLLAEALKYLGDASLELTVCGADSDDAHLFAGVPTHFTGTLHDDLSLRAWYSACDVVVVPSRLENLSNVILEALACGTPVACFDIGGNSDLVIHKATGYLAKALDAEDLANGIRWLLIDAPEGIGAAGRRHVVDTYSAAHISSQYLDLYREVLARPRGST